MPVLEKFIQRYNGSSIPSLVQAVGGRRYVLKMRGAGNGVQSLAAEFLVNRAAHSLGWPVPQADTLTIPAGFPWTFGTDEFDEILQRSYGANLGLADLGETEALTAEAVRSLPEEFLGRMASLDAFFLNYDRLPGSRNTLRDAGGQVWLIDHGSALFLDPDLAGKPLALAPGHLLGAGAALQPNWALAVGEAALPQVKELPQDWLAALGLTMAQIEGLLQQRLSIAHRALKIL